MEQKTSEFDKVLGAWDILVIAFGAMIGWGWVVSSGNWIESGGVLGAAIAFAIGGIMIFFVGLTYAELTAAMPQCGGSSFADCSYLYYRRCRNYSDRGFCGYRKCG